MRAVPAKKMRCELGYSCRGRHRTIHSGADQEGGASLPGVSSSGGLGDIMPSSDIRDDCLYRTRSAPSPAHPARLFQASITTLDFRSRYGPDKYQMFDDGIITLKRVRLVRDTVNGMKVRENGPSVRGEGLYRLSTDRFNPWKRMNGRSGNEQVSFSPRLL